MRISGWQIIPMCQERGRERERERKKKIWRMRCTFSTDRTIVAFIENIISIELIFLARSFYGINIVL